MTAGSDAATGSSTTAGSVSGCSALGVSWAPAGVLGRDVLRRLGVLVDVVVAFGHFSYFVSISSIGCGCCAACGCSGPA